MPSQSPTSYSDTTYQKMAQVVDYFIHHQAQQPSLSEIAGQANLSEAHLQKLFSKWVGVSPKQFLKFLTKEQAKKRLRSNGFDHSVMDAALDVGLSGSGRLHDLMITSEGVTPGEYKRWGDGLLIEYGHGVSPFGYCFIAFTQKGLCKLAFYDTEQERSQNIEELQAHWPHAKLGANQGLATQWLERIFDEAPRDTTKPLHVIMKGSPFQLQVWQALLAIPEGELCTYQQVADFMGKPTAVRAVASAIARNHIGYLIPCHRVIRSTGEFSQYRWSAHRKPVMIGWEACRT